MANRLTRARDAVRASDEDRERVVALLRHHRTAGRLSVDELDQRIEQALAARTLGELATLTRDLPDHGGGGPTRTELLDRAIAEGIRKGWRLESRSRSHAVMVSGSRPNHLVHGLLTVFTGLWGLVWLAVALSGGERRLLIEVDASGQTTIERVR